MPSEISGLPFFAVCRASSSVRDSQFAGGLRFRQSFGIFDWGIWPQPAAINSFSSCMGLSQRLSTFSRWLVLPAESGLKTFGALTLRPATMICRSVGICMRFVVTRDAAEL